MMRKKASCSRRRLSALLAQLVVPEQTAAVSGSHFSIEPNPGTTLGAVVRGLSLQEGMSPEVEERIKEAFLEHGVLVFEGQQGLTSEAQIAFGQRFGKLEFEKLAISNEKKNGDLVRPGEASHNVLLGTQVWHMDSTYLPTSAKCGILYAEKLPPSGGGETEWADMRSAFDSLPEERRAWLETLSAYHSSQYTAARRTGSFPPRSGNVGNGYGMGGNAYLRPLVKTHPETGRKSLFVSSHAFGIPGMDPDTSTQILDDLVTDACQAPRVFSHSWKVGDIAIWDNRCVLHRGRPYDINEPRVMRSTRVAGEPETEAALPADDGAEVLARELARLRKLPVWTEEERNQHIR